MGLFQKSAASKFLSSSFAIEAEEKIINVDNKDVLQDNVAEEVVADDVLDQTLADDIEEAEFELIESEKINAGDESLSISQVIKLVRSLPQQGTEVELHAVLRTLELFNIDVGNVLEDSYRKQTVTTQRIDTLLSEISTLDEEMDKRAKEIKMLEVGITEMSRVNECLELMLKLDDELLQAEQESTRGDDSYDSSTTDEKTDLDRDSTTEEQPAETTILTSTSDKEILDDYVREGKTQTLDGIVIDLDSPPTKQKLKLPKRSKTKKRKAKAPA